MGKRVPHFVTETLSPTERAFGCPSWKWRGNRWEAVNSMGVLSQVKRESTGLYSLQRFERGAWVTVSKDRDPKRLLPCLA
ncbi:MAG: hypothetical protein E6R04_01070 [Spirochaetes bacterium]|nr:MAG: hypothetical protein E6R04_01070 [Spirochaetota bacterium]